MTIVPATAWLAMLVGCVAVSPAAAANTADPAAMRAFETVVKSYRARPGLGVTATLQIGLAEGDLEAEGEKVVAEFLYAKGSGRVKIRDFTCRFHDDKFVVVHNANDAAYYDEPLDGAAPYWLLFDTFRDMPYPHLAIFWGEPAIDEALIAAAAPEPAGAPLHSTAAATWSDRARGASARGARSGHEPPPPPRRTPRSSTRHCGHAPTQMRRRADTARPQAVRCGRVSLDPVRQLECSGIAEAIE